MNRFWMALSQGDLQALSIRTMSEVRTSVLRAMTPDVAYSIRVNLNNDRKLRFSLQPDR